ncbi:hypothetical protein GBW32_22185 [Streptomyces tsukubensis]|nr:hypothetical protein GBW32_22185 [Streptomyces tsukubensis]
MLLLTACGGEDDGADKGGGSKIAGADQGGDGKKSPSPSVSSTAGDRPAIKLPSDLSYSFDWKTGDPKKDAVLGDAEQFLKAVDLAIVKQNPLHEAYRFYSEGKEAAAAQKYVKSYSDDQASVTGLSRFYDASVTLKKGNQASAVYCQDMSKSFDKSLKTGKPQKTPGSKDDYVLNAMTLHKNARGIWAASNLIAEPGSVKCQP